MKIKTFAVSCPINIELDYFVHIKFSYGDGNHGDDMMPHQDEIIDIIDYKFEPAHLEETSALDYDGLVALCYDYEHEWQSLED